MSKHDHEQAQLRSPFSITRNWENRPVPVIFGSVLYFTQHIPFGQQVNHARSEIEDSCNPISKQGNSVIQSGRCQSIRVYISKLLRLRSSYLPALATRSGRSRRRGSGRIRLLIVQNQYLSGRISVFIVALSLDSEQRPYALP